MDGTPELGALERYAVWSKVAGAEYAALFADVERHRETSIDPYGATNAPEFFAVVVEQFFENRRRSPSVMPSSIGSGWLLSLRSRDAAPRALGGASGGSSMKADVSSSNARPHAWSSEAT